MARALSYFAIVAAMVFTGCSDDTADGWKFDENPGNENPGNENPGNENPGETNNLDPGTTPDDPPVIDPETCEAEALTLGPPTFLAGSPMEAGRSIVMTDLGIGAFRQGELTFWSPEFGESVFPLELGDVVVGAGGPTVLSLSNRTETPYYALNISTGAAPFELGAGDRPNLAYLNSWDGDLPRFVDTNGHAVFISDGRLQFWDTVEVFFVAETPAYTFEIGEGRIGWAETRGQRRYVGTWSFNEVETVEVEGSDQPIAFEVFEEGLFWSTREQLWLWNENDEPQQIGEVCTPASFDRTTRRAYYACSDSGDFDGPYTIFEWSEGGAQPIWTSMIRPYGLVADGGIVVWAEYSSSPDTPLERGVLYGWSSGMELPQELDTIGQGCLSCGAYWTPAEILLEDGLIGWTYANEDGGDFATWENHVEAREISIDCRE